MNRILKLPDTARVWIYQSNRPFSKEEVSQLNEKLEQFAVSWASHGLDLVATGEILHNRFVVLAVDQQQAGASGCSIDSSVRFIKELEATYDINLFDRMLFAYELDGAVHAASRDEFGVLYAKGKINDHTTVFNNLVDTVGALRDNWKVQLSKSWHANMV